MGERENHALTEKLCCVSAPARCLLLLQPEKCTSGACLTAAGYCGPLVPAPLERQQKPELS